MAYGPKSLAVSFDAEHLRLFSRIFRLNIMASPESAREPVENKRNTIDVEDWLNKELNEAYATIRYYQSREGYQTNSEYQRIWAENKSRASNIELLMMGIASEEGHIGLSEKNFFFIENALRLYMKTAGAGHESERMAQAVSISNYIELHKTRSE